MRKIIYLLLINFGISQNMFCQDIKNNGFGISYTIIYNDSPIFNLYDGLSPTLFIHNLNIFKNRILKSKGEILYGASFSYFNGKTQLSSQAYNSFSNSYVNYTRDFTERINFSNLYFAYQFKPLNEKENFFFRVFVQPGIAFYKNKVVYSPEISNIGLSNSTYKSSEFSFNGGVHALNKIYSSERISMQLKYGVIYQFIDLYYEKINLFVGIEIDF